MKLETAIITVCFIIKCEGYVANVNTRLTTEQPTIDDKVDLKTMNFKNVVGTSNHENLISTTTSSYDESRIIFPSDEPNERAYNKHISTDMPGQMGGQAETRLSPSDPIKSKPAKHEQLSRYSFGNPYERDDDNYRPIWRS